MRFVIELILRDKGNRCLLFISIMMLEKRLRSSVKAIVVDDDKNGFDIDVEKTVCLLIDVQIKTSNFKSTDN